MTKMRKPKGKPIEHHIEEKDREESGEKLRKTQKAENAPSFDHESNDSDK